MNTRADKEKQKQIQEKCQIILGNLLREEDNKYCVDCDAKGPRWASWNLGIFLCIRCAGIHRNLGVHISKVKSVNLDTWTPEQVACLQQMGNSQARAVYEANLPDNFRRPQTDSSLEAFIRAKYEQKKYIAKEWVPPPAPKPAFDIEEEKRREREKKRMRTKVANTVEIPQVPQQPAALPRPHSAGPQSTSPIAITQETSETKPLQAQQQSTTADLLSLDVSYNQPSDDPFDAFLSAPQASIAPTTSASLSPVTTSEVTASASNKSADEADFFNQTSSTDIPKKNMMTKESILSLYSSGSSQTQQTQPQPPIYGIPGGMYVNQQVYPQMGMAGIASAPSQGIPNGITNIPQMSGVQQPGSNMNTVTNPFASLGAPSLGQEMGQHSGTWVTAPAGGGTNPLIMAHGIGQDFFGDSNAYDLMWDIKDINHPSYSHISNTVPFTNISNLAYQMPTEYQLQQRMANIQLSGQAAWNVAGVTQVSSTGMVIGGSQPASGMVWPGTAHGQTLSTNLWQ